MTDIEFNLSSIEVGTPGDDNLVGTAAGGDLLQGLAGNDRLDGLLGADTMEGGTGNDTYIVDDLNDIVIESEDAIDPVTGQPIVIGGIDRVFVFTSSYKLPRLVEQAEVRFFPGQEAPNATLVGNELNNTLFGDEGADLLDGGKGADFLGGGAGNDTYIVDNIGDVILESADLGEGDDLVLTSISFTLTNSSFVNRMTATGSGNLNLTGNELDNTLTGNGGSNKIFGDIGNDTLAGNAGNDILNGGTGFDRLVGGLGNDTYVTDSSKDVVVESANGGSDRVLSNATFSLFKLAQVENISAYSSLDKTNINFSGNSDNNIVSGNAGKNTLKGAAGNDKLLGQAGDDTLSGNVGLDTLIGGAGEDKFVFDAPASQTSYDVILDYSVADDTLVISNNVSFFKNVGPNGKLDAKTFVLGKTAQDANDHVIYDKASGNLYFDADGSGASAQVRVAHFTNKAALTAGEFLIV